jgi:GNAT superfamily N-acetyltransferase
MQLKVRLAKLSDAAFLADSNARMAFETEGRRLDPVRLAAGVNALLADETKGTYYVAEVDGKVAGQLLITHEWSDWRNGDFWWIQSVYVSDEFRGDGVFRALFNHVHALAKADPDVCGLRLYMEAHNARARAAYERLGLKQTEYQVFEMDFVLAQ